VLLPVPLVLPLVLHLMWSAALVPLPLPLVLHLVWCWSPAQSLLLLLLLWP